MQKPTVKFKTYKQSARVGGKIYGVADLSDPQIASVTMQEVIDYAKLHNYSASTLEALLSQVISGVADLVARDGRPRNLSDLLKFEPVIKGTFSNMEQSVTNQKVVIRPRLLKEIRVNISADSFAWQNQNDTLSPVIRSVAPISQEYSDVSIASFTASIGSDEGFGWTLAGSRLAPNGWDASCSFEVVLFRPNGGFPGLGEDDYLHFERAMVTETGVPDPLTAGCFLHNAGDEATDNAIALTWGVPDSVSAWYYHNTGADPVKRPYETELVPQAGDVLTFRFTRTVASGDTFTAEKSYTL